MRGTTYAVCAEDGTVAAHVLTYCEPGFLHEAHRDLWRRRNSLPRRPMVRTRARCRLRIKRITPPKWPGKAGSTHRIRWVAGFGTAPRDEDLRNDYWDTRQMVEELTGAGYALLPCQIEGAGYA